MKIACVVLPTFNEAENVRVLIPWIFEQGEKIPTHELHVLVVDDDSSDGTAGVVRELARTCSRLHLLAGRKEGLGVAYRRGFESALEELRADLIFEMDADLQHDPALLPEFVRLIDAGHDLVIGSRFAPGGSTPNFPWSRRIISLAGTRLVRWFGGLPPLADCTSGYRCIRADLLARCDLAQLPARGYSFQSSLLFELARNGARIIEVPIVFAERRRGESKLSFRDKTEFLRNLVWLFRRRRKVKSR